VIAPSGQLCCPSAAALRSSAGRVRAGTVNINRHITDFALPFGGYKQSGIGREGGPGAVASYLETKVIGPLA